MCSYLPLGWLGPSQHLPVGVGVGLQDLVGLLPDERGVEPGLRLVDVCLGVGQLVGHGRRHAPPKTQQYIYFYL